MTSPRPVLLVPGAVGQDLVYWNLFQRRLRRDGYVPYTATFPRFTMADLRVSADVLARRVESICDVHGYDRVGIVAHSMGGLVARWWLKYMEGKRRAGAVVFLGTPHKGTLAGVTGLPFRGARQVVPGSPFLNELNHGDGLSGVPVTNVWSLTDFIIVPQRSAFLEHPEAENRQVTLAGHWGMLVSRTVYGHVREGLARGDWDAARPFHRETRRQGGEGEPAEL